MAFPTVEATNGGFVPEVTGDITEHTVNLPANIGAGDLLIVLFCSDGDPTITFPNEGVDWIQLCELVSDNTPKFAVAYRIADGNEGATITVTTSIAQRSSHITYRISGYSGVPEIATNTGDSVNPDPPSLSPTWGTEDTLWIACSGSDHMDAITAFPTNYTDTHQYGDVDFATCRVGSAQRELSTDSEDPGTFTLAGGETWVAATIGIRPAPPAPPYTPENKSANIGSKMVAAGLI